MPTTSCKEPTKESQDTKPSVVKWGCEGPLLIYLLLPPAMRARALGGQGAHNCGHGAHVCEGARTSAGGAHASGVGRARQRGGGRARLRVRAHTPAMRGGAHAYEEGGAHG
jgi:hypothetical protein